MKISQHMIVSLLINRLVKLCTLKVKVWVRFGREINTYQTVN